MILVPFPYVDVLLSVPTGHQLSITHSTPILDITHTLQEHLTAFVSIISVFIGVLSTIDVSRRSTDRLDDHFE